MNRALIAICAGFLATACISGYEILSADVSPTGWNEPVVMSYVNSDSLAVRGLIFSLRGTIEATPHEGVYVIGATSPSGAQFRDTLRVALAGFGTSAFNNNLRETRTPLHSQMRLDETGEWTVSVAPMQEVRGVWSIALNFN
jgi:hypothetical protein